MTDRTLATAFLILLGASVCIFSWQSHRISRLEALSASLSASLEKYDESTVRELKSLREALRGLDFDLDVNGCTEGMKGCLRKESGHVLP